MPGRDEVGLVEAMSSLRAELEQAVAAAQGAKTRFTCKSIQVQLQVTVTNALKANAGASLWSVVTVGAGYDRTRADVHQVTLVLEPHLDGVPSSSVDIDDMD